MSTASREVLASARLDLGEVLRSRWLSLAILVYASLGAAILFAGMRSSEVLGFTGMSRVLLSLTHVLLVVLPLLSLMGTSGVVARAREDGSLELLFSHPLSRTHYLLSLALTRYLVLALPLVVLFGVLAGLATAFGEVVPWEMALRSVLVSCALLWAFAGLGLAISVGQRNQTRTLVRALLVWAACVALLDLGLVGLLLQWQVEPRLVFALAAVNPVELARLALLSGLDPELSTLGPVGFFLFHRVGPQNLFALGVGWPAVLGTAAFSWSVLDFRRGDVL
jgi:ABC-2 type transport system permease protein